MPCRSAAAPVSVSARAAGELARGRMNIEHMPTRAIGNDTQVNKIKAFCGQR
jgi:hypothetical protein